MLVMIKILLKKAHTYKTNDNWEIIAQFIKYYNIISNVRLKII